MTTNGTAMVVREPGGLVTTETGGAAMIPRGIEECMHLATIVAKSGLFGVKNPEDAFVRIAMGLELGMTPIVALRNIFSIGGKPGIDAAAMVGLCLAKPTICARFECDETTAQRATWTAQRVGGTPRSLTFTIEEARQAGLAGKEIWKSYAPAMLRARAASALARIVFPDLMAGIYTVEELESMREEPRREERPGPRKAPPPPPPESSPRAVEQPSEGVPSANDLHAAIENAATYEALQAVGKNLAKFKGPLYVDLPRLREAYAKRKAELLPKAGAA